MSTDEVLALWDEARRNAVPEGMQQESTDHVHRLFDADGIGHQIAFSRLTEQNAEKVIASEVARYRRLGVEVEWTVHGHDRPANLRHLLARQGFEVGAREEVLVLDLSSELDDSTGPVSKQVQRVHDEPQCEAFRRVSNAVFGSGASRVADRLLAAVRAGSQQNLGYVAYVGEEPASVGRLILCPPSPFAGLYSGATLPQFRGRGLYRATVAARAREARARGARFAQVDALPTSAPILRRLGFWKLADAWPCVLRPAGS